MQFIDNLKLVFTGIPQKQTTFYGTTLDWFSSPDGKKAFENAKGTMQQTDYFYHYFKALNPATKLADETLYKMGFIFADALLPSQQPYASKDQILNVERNPFAAYLKNINRPVGAKALCYELLLILLECTDPFDSTSWLYDTARAGYSEEEYKKIAEEKQIDFRQLLEVKYDGKEDLRYILCSIIWLIGQKEFFSIVG